MRCSPPCSRVVSTAPPGARRPGTTTASCGGDPGTRWSTPWRLDGGAALDLAVTLEEVPCQFRRSIRLFAAGARLDLCYELENHGGRDLPYLWAAHPLIPIEPGMRLELPPGNRPGHGRRRGAAAGPGHAVPVAPGAGGKAVLSWTSAPWGVPARRRRSRSSPKG